MAQPKEDAEQEISTAEEGRAFLEKFQLIVPSGDELSAESLAVSLFHISELKGVHLPVKNAVRSVAYLLRELGSNETAKIVAERVISKGEEENNKLSSSVSSLTREIKEAVNTAISDVQATLSEAVKKLTNEVQAISAQVPNDSSSPSSPYRNALMRPADAALQSRVDPRVRAREGIRLRQVLLECSKDSAYHTYEIPKVIERFNKVIKKISSTTNHKVMSATRLRNGGLLLEMDSEEGAGWLREREIGEKLAEEIMEARIKNRSFNTIAHFVPLTFDPDNPEHLREIEQTNGFNVNAIIKAKWAKPPQRRSPSQTSGHLIVSYADPDVGNLAILKGLVVCHKRVSVLKCKREPVRCLKCHGWNHVATACEKTDDKCGTCGGGHRTNSCSSSGTPYCVPCGAAGHASWDRKCPTFEKKCRELDEKYPDNSLPFFPSKELWTWAPEPPKSTPAPSFFDSALCNSQPSQRNGPQQTTIPFAHQQTAPNGRPLERLSWDRPEQWPSLQPTNSSQTQNRSPPSSSPPQSAPSSSQNVMHSSSQSPPSSSNE